MNSYLFFKSWFRHMSRKPLLISTLALIFSSPAIGPFLTYIHASVTALTTGKYHLFIWPRRQSHLRCGALFQAYWLLKGFMFLCRTEVLIFLLAVGWGGHSQLLGATSNSPAHSPLQSMIVCFFKAYRKASAIVSPNFFDFSLLKGFA